jgi:hypothetical protein
VTVIFSHQDEVDMWGVDVAADAAARASAAMLSNVQLLHPRSDSASAAAE